MSTKNVVYIKPYKKVRERDNRSKEERKKEGKEIY